MTTQTYKVTGAMFKAALSKMGAYGKQIDTMDNLAASLNTALKQAPKLTRKGIASFMATMMQESAWFRTRTEYGTATKRYDPYRGRTFEQLTWKANYASFGAWCKAQGLVDSADYFVANPTKLSDEQWQWLGGIWYFTARKLWDYANAGNHLAVQRAVNLGSATTTKTPSGWPTRKKAYNACLSAIKAGTATTKTTTTKATTTAKIVPLEKTLANLQSFVKWASAGSSKFRGYEVRGIPYLLGGEVTKPLDWLPLETDHRPTCWDCSELTQFFATIFGEPGLGDGAWLQYPKCKAVAEANWRPGDLIFKKNNSAHGNKVGHVAVLIGKINGAWYVLEAKGHAYGTVVTKLSDFRARYGGAYVRRYPGLVFSGTTATVKVVVYPATIQYGSRGATVKRLQKKLRALGYRGDVAKSHALVVDGDFGAETRRAVRRFQKAKGLVVDGEVGPKTWAQLGITAATNAA